MRFRIAIFALLGLIIAWNPIFAQAMIPDLNLATDNDLGLPIQPTVKPRINVEEQINKLLQGELVSDDGHIQVVVKVDQNFDGNLPFGLTVLHKFKRFPLISAKGTPDQINALRKVAGIAGVYPDSKFYLTWIKPDFKDVRPAQFKAGVNYPFIGKFPTLLNESTALIGAKEVVENGFTGKGVVIAILDTGVNPDHPNFLDNDGNSKVIKRVSMVPDEDATDEIGHGTLVASIAAGNGAAGSKGFFSSFFVEFVNASIIPGTQKGVAPEAKIISVKVISKFGFGTLSWIVSGIEFAMENGADVINMSLGGAVIDTKDPIIEALNKAVDSGVVVVTSAGNNGPGQFSVSSPGIAEKAIAVGLAYKTDTVTYFTGRGPAPFTLRAKPDLVAPGSELVAANAFFQQTRDSFYLSAWGTSFSAPHVAGAIALLIQAFPGASPMTIKAALMKTARDLGLDPSVQGAGMIDVAAAYKLLKNSPITSSKIKPFQKTIEAAPAPTLTGSKILFTGDIDNFTRYIEELEKAGATIDFGGPFPENATLSVTAPPLTGVPTTGIDKVLAGNIVSIDISATPIFDQHINRIFLAFQDFSGVWHTIRDESGDLGHRFSYTNDTINARRFHIIISEFDPDNTPGGFDVTASLKLGKLLPDGHNVWIVSKIAKVEQIPELARLARNLVPAKNSSLLVIGDVLADKYNGLTKRFSIEWAPLGTAVGGLSTNFADHVITKDVTSVDFGFPLTSLRVAGEKAETIVFDPVLPGVVIWEDAKTARVAAISDDDVLNNDFLDASNNLKLGLNIAAWLSEPFKAEDPVHDVSLGLVYPASVAANTTPTFRFNVTNFGGFTENVNLTVRIQDQNATEVFNKTQPISVRSHSSHIEEISTTLKRMDKEFAFLTISGRIEANSTQVTTSNDNLNATFSVINKISRNDRTAVVTYISPSRITSLSPPYIAMFPGDFNLANLTLITGGTVVNGRLLISDSISDIVSFTNAVRLSEHNVITIPDFTVLESTPYAFNHDTKYRTGPEFKLADFQGEAFAPIQINIPESKQPGEYSGKITLMNGTAIISDVKVAITVKTPKAKLLYDDVFDFYFAPFHAYLDAERLWGGINFIRPNPDVSDYWRELALNGYQVQSLRQVMYDSRPNPTIQLTGGPTQYGYGLTGRAQTVGSASSEDPWSLFLSAKQRGYSAIIIHDKEEHSFETSAWPKILASGVSLITHFDQDFPALFATSPVETFPEKILGFGIIRNLNSASPVARDVANATFFGSVTLATPASAEVVATGTDSFAGPPRSGILAATFKAQSGAKQIAIGDSNLFEFLGSRDLQWLFFQIVANQTVTNSSDAQLGLSEVRYATNQPPNIVVTPVNENVAPSEQLQFTVSSDKDASIEIAVKDSTGALVAKENGRINEAKTTLSISVPANVSLGKLTVEVTATDDMGDKSSRAATVSVIDKTPPSLSLIQPQEAQDFDQGQLTFSWNSDDKESKIASNTIQMDGGTVQDLAQSQSFSESTLPATIHKVTVKTTNQAGLSTEKTVQFTIGKRSAQAAIEKAKNFVESTSAIVTQDGSVQIEQAKEQLEMAIRAFEQQQFSEAIEHADKATQDAIQAQESERRVQEAERQAQESQRSSTLFTFIISAVGLSVATLAIVALVLNKTRRMGGNVTAPPSTTQQPTSQQPTQPESRVDLGSSESNTQSKKESSCSQAQ